MEEKPPSGWDWISRIALGVFFGNLLFMGVLWFAASFILQWMNSPAPLFRI